ncbi:hypothetical protein JCM3765_005182 [Sporobolomyces pararoseus]
MSSFQRLPPELKERICLYSHLADEAYHSRLERLESDPAKPSTKISWLWGRSLSKLSAVNKELRSYCVVHLFSTLRVSKVEDPTFTEDILNSSLRAVFTTIDFEFDNTNPRAILFALLKVVPRLPKLNRISGLDRDVMEVMFGEGGMLNTRNQNLLDSDQKIQAWSEFKALAKRIKHLEAELNGNEFEYFSSIDSKICTNLRSLSLITLEEGGFAILEDPNSKFPALLSTLPRLESLKVTKSLVLDSGQRFLPPLSKNSISTPYSFCSTLTSFTHYSDPSSLWSKIDLDFLQFLTRFPILQHLKIAGNKFEIPQPQPQPQPQESSKDSIIILLPNVNKLELDCYEPNGFDLILNYLKLPKLFSLILKYEVLNPVHYHRNNYNNNLQFETENLKGLKKRIDRVGGGSLRTVSLIHSDGTTDGLYQSTLDCFNEEEGGEGEGGVPSSYTVYTDFQPGLPEAHKTWVNTISTKSTATTTRGCSNEEEEEALINGMINGIENLQSWIKEECRKSIRDRDSSRVQHLIHTLSPVWDLKQWNMD